VPDAREKIAKIFHLPDEIARPEGGQRRNGGLAEGKTRARRTLADHRERERERERGGRISD